MAGDVRVQLPEGGDQEGEKEETEETEEKLGT